MQGPCLSGLLEKYLWFPLFVKENVSRPPDPCGDEWVFFLILSSENPKNSIYYNKFWVAQQGKMARGKKKMKAGKVFCGIDRKLLMIISG
jgi:hypothetical protein